MDTTQTIHHLGKTDDWPKMPFLKDFVFYLYTKTFQKMLIFEILNYGFIGSQHLKSITERKFFFQPLWALQKDIV